MVSDSEASRFQIPFSESLRPARELEVASRSSTRFTSKVNANYNASISTPLSGVGAFEN
jgi:hypothetical protein